MKNIQQKQSNFQIFLEWLKFTFRLFFGEFPLAENQPYVCPVKLADARQRQNRAPLKRAVAAFELKKRGGLTR